MTSNNNHSPFQDKYEFDDSVIQALKKKPGKIPSNGHICGTGRVDDSGQQKCFAITLQGHLILNCLPGEGLLKI